MNGIPFFDTMDGLQVANDSEKILGSRVAPNRPYVESSPGLETVAGHEHAPTTANPAGLKPLTFGLLVAAVTCILTAGIVGGVTGGVLGHKTSKLSVDFYLSRIEHERLMSLKPQHPV